MNSPPMRVAAYALATTITTAATTTEPGNRIAPPSSGRYTRLAPRMKKFSFSENLPVTKIATAAGTNVIEKMAAPSKCHQHGQRHRREHLAFDPGQGEDRQVDDRDDHRAEQARLDHFAGSFDDGLQALPQRKQTSLPALPIGKQSEAVLDDDDGAVDDDAEVDRAEAHQVGADPRLHHAGDGEQHRQRNHAGGDDRGADVSEDQKQHGDHQQRALDQVLLDGLDGGLDQAGAVVDRPRDDALRAATS